MIEAYLTPRINYAFCKFCYIYIIP